MKFLYTVVAPLLICCKQVTCGQVEKVAQQDSLATEITILQHALRSEKVWLSEHHKDTPHEETNGEKEERREARSLAGALGTPHSGEPIDDSGVAPPLTIAEDSIHGENALDSVHGMAKNIIVPVSGILLLCIMMTNLIALTPLGGFIPGSALTIGIALSLGLGVRSLMAAGLFSEHTFTFVSSTVLNLVLLPIIIFNSGWGLQSKNFMSQFEYILIFAILGTIISTLFIGFGMWFMASAGFHVVHTLRSNLVFAALISAVDPVATLATYCQLGVPQTQPLLNIMVFGESAINDAVAIVLFGIVNEDWDDLSMKVAFIECSWLLFGSLFFGVICAGILVLCMRLARLPGHTSAEILFIAVSAYFIFGCAEGYGFSGIIANLFAGIIFGIYGRQHLSEDGKKEANEYLELSGELADKGVFVLCGVSSALVNFNGDGLRFGIWALTFCLVARALSVGTCGAITNWVKKMEEEENPLSWRHQVMMWHGALRGGIALVLALEIGPWCNHKTIIINITFVLTCLFLLTLGGTTELMLKKLGMVKDIYDHEPDVALQIKTNPRQEGELKERLQSEKYVYVKVFRFLDSIFSKVLVGEDAAANPKPSRQEQTKLFVEQHARSYSAAKLP